MSKTLTTTIIAALILLVPVLANCGSDDNSRAAQPPPTTLSRDALCRQHSHRFLLDRASVTSLWPSSPQLTTLWKGELICYARDNYGSRYHCVYTDGRPGYESERTADQCLNKLRDQL